VEYDIQRERPAQLLDHASRLDLALEGWSAGDPVRDGGLVGLDADLYVIEASRSELLSAAPRKTDRTGDEVGVQAQLIGGHLGAVTARSRGSRAR
jgi:hypothetical protein